MVIPMTHNLLYNIYIASCAEDGGIYNFTLNNNGILQKKDYVSLNQPMYIAKSNDLLYVLLRSPFHDSIESGMIKISIGQKMNLDSHIFHTHGIVACHLCVLNGTVYITNYLSGNIVKFPDIVVTHTGNSVNPLRQSTPHTHFVNLTPDGKYICCTDLGCDKIYFYDVNLNYMFDVSVPAGSGARHIAFSDDGKFLYCANELSNTVSVFSYDEQRTKYLKDYSTLPDNFNKESSVAAIKCKGKYLYVSNRGHDSIACFEISRDNLKLIGFFHTGGSSPRDFNIFGDYLVCANELTDNITVFEIKNGVLIKQSQEINIKNPLCVI